METGQSNATPPAGRPARGTPLRADFEVFRPKPRRSDLAFGRGVGPGEANQPADVLRAQRLLSNAGTLSFAVPQERSGQPSPALTRATRQFQANRGLAVDGRITKSGETLRGLDTTLFATDEAEEEFPEEPPEGVDPEEPPKENDPKEPPKEEKLEKPPKEKEDTKKECASLAQDLENLGIHQRETRERVDTANEGAKRTREKIATLKEKLRKFRMNTMREGGGKGSIAGVVQESLKKGRRTPQSILGSAAAGAVKGVVEDIAKNAGDVIEILQRLAVLVPI